MATKRALGRALGMGALSGMRALSSPAILSRHASRGAHGAAGGGAWKNGLDFDRTPFQWMGRSFYSALLGLLAAGEGMGDKNPRMPARTAPASLAIRAASGALVGAAIFAGEDEKPLQGAALGAGAAVAMTFVAYWIRKRIAQDGRVSDKVLGMGEDVLVGFIGSGLLKKTSR